MGAGRGPGRGFTLVELQIALLLVALIAALLTGGLRLGAQTWNRVSEKQTTSEHHYIVADFLRRHLNRMRFVRVLTAETERFTSFFGTDHQVHFVAPFPTFRNDGELYWWTLASRWNEEDRIYQLVLDYLPFTVGERVILERDGSIVLEDQVPTTIVVADNLSLDGIEYFERDHEGVEEWIDEWEGSNFVPQAIRLRLIESDGEGEMRALPELVVAPRYARQELSDVE